MARPLSKVTLTLRDTLRAMVRDGFRQPGERFVSARYVSQRFRVSYQTAHRLLAGLEQDGLITRRTGSGTYIAGEKISYQRAVVLFAPRARRAESFGDFLLRQLVASLEQQKIPFTVELDKVPISKISEQDYPVIWERPDLVRSLSQRHRRCLVLHDLPPPGIASLFVDAVSVDNFSGGMSAGQILARFSPKQPAIVTGPRSDVRSALRTTGFQHIFPDVLVIEVDSWFNESAEERIFPKLLKAEIDALFCCSDRLAAATINCYGKLKRPAPPLVSFDNTPLAEQMHISAIGIPWERVCKEAAAIIKLRLANQEEAASCKILPPEPVIRILRPHLFE